MLSVEERYPVGQRWVVKRGRDYDRSRYGSGFTVVSTCTVVDYPAHPGFCHHEQISLVSDSGIKVEWPPSTLKTIARLDTSGVQK